MTAHRDLKRIIRERQSKTGESYTAALRHFPAEPGGRPMTTTAETRGHFRCSFCGKTSVEVKKLVAGPGVYICDGCVALCGEMIAEEDPLDTPRLPTDAPPEVVLMWLRGVAGLSKQSSMTSPSRSPSSAGAASHGARSPEPSR